MKEVLSILALSCAVSTASASGIGYNYFQGGIATNDVDGADSALFINGSYGVTPNINIVAGFASIGIDSNSSIDASISTYTIGVGYHQSMAEKTDVFGEIQYLNLDLDLSTSNAYGSYDIGDGFGGRLGLRHQVSDKIEGEVSVNYASIEGETDTTFEATGRYFFNNQISASLGFSTADDSGVTGALRYNF